MTFADMVGRLLEDFSGAALPVDVGQWQSLDVSGDPSKVTWELREAVMEIGMSEVMDQAQATISPNLPWAEDHFQERVQGRPLNPPPSQAWWPFAQQGHKGHVDGAGKFSHTYPERFWPRHAGHDRCNCPFVAEMEDGKKPGFYSDSWDCHYKGRRGIRFNYGDLYDVILRLVENPYTRQAYLPVWFPEDTGAPKGERVPCSLGYLFMIRDNQLHVTYHIRSCDFMRHFRDDVYMAMRLGQYVREAFIAGTSQDNEVEMGMLTMHISSLHIFEGDRAMVEYLRAQATMQRSVRLLGSLG